MSNDPLCPCCSTPMKHSRSQKGDLKCPKCGCYDCANKISPDISDEINRAPLEPELYSEKFTLAITPKMKQRIRKLPKEAKVGAPLRSALEDILDELEQA